MSDIVCQRWGSTKFPWKKANWKWSQCPSITPPFPGKRICHRWGTTNIKWKNADWKWSECQLVVEVFQFLNTGIDATTLIPPWLRQPDRPIDDVPPWEKNKEKKRRLIRLICKVKNEKYDESKELRDDIKIKAEDIQLIIKATLGIEIDVKDKLKE